MKGNIVDEERASSVYVVNLRPQYVMDSALGLPSLPSLPAHHALRELAPSVAFALAIG